MSGCLPAVLQEELSGSSKFFKNVLLAFVVFQPQAKLAPAGRNLHLENGIPTLERH